MTAASESGQRRHEVRRTGVVGGSGVYQLDGLEQARWEAVSSSFGTPSDALLLGRLAEHEVAFLPRHGRGHQKSPSEIDYRANVDALKRAGVAQLLSVSAVGSLREELAPGTFVLVDQFVDRTFGRASSFFGSGVVAHVSMGHPTCPRLAEATLEAARALGVACVRGGTYLAMEGPQFSTLAESRLYQSWGCSVIGMTNLPEAKLAREAELCYGPIAMVTDYDAWHPEHEHVTVDQVIATLHGNAERARALVRAVIERIGGFEGPCPHGCDRALELAIITPPERRDPAAVERLSAVAGRVLQKP